MANALIQESPEEMQFQKWIRATPWFSEYVREYGEEPDLNIKDYDYRQAWKAGVQPVQDKYDRGRYHWPSVNPQTGQKLKSKTHPTAWKEIYMQKTGVNPDSIGLARPPNKNAFTR